MAWIKIDSGLAVHPKTYRLQELLASSGVKENWQAVGIIATLFAWVSVNAYDGDLSKHPVKAISDAIGWRKSPQKLLDALVGAGFIDRDGDRLTVHDWDEYQELAIDRTARRREQTRKRVQEYRNRKSGVTEQQTDKQCNAESALHSVTDDVTVTPCNTPYDNEKEKENKNISETRNTPTTPISPSVTQKQPNLQTLNEAFTSAHRCFPGKKPDFLSGSDIDRGVVFGRFCDICRRSGDTMGAAFHIKTKAAYLFAVNPNGDDLPEFSEWMEQAVKDGFA